MSNDLLLLSAYDAMSHKQWRERLARMLPEFNWTQIALPPRHHDWRIRGNSLQWFVEKETTLKQPYSALIATSMVDLAALRGLVPELAKLPTLLYFHENEFAYPANSRQRANIEPMLVPVYSALCADLLVFNSNYNRDTFLAGLKHLFQQLPDNLADSILERLPTVNIAPVPLSNISSNAVTKRTHLELLWNHRWEYDKNPALLLLVAQKIAALGLPCRIQVVGQQFKQQPAEFLELKNVLDAHHARQDITSGRFGFVEDDAEYQALLQGCHVVLSTALHDFQGLAIMEAIQAGCTPLCPAALAYPEYLDAQFLYPIERTMEESADHIVERLQAWLQIFSAGQDLPQASVAAYSMSNLQCGYRSMITELIKGNCAAPN